MAEDAMYRALAPRGWNEHWDSLPNAVRALYATFVSVSRPRRMKEERIEAWGQLCFDDAAALAVAYHMWNKGMRSGWVYICWRVEMDGPLVGPHAKLRGVAPLDFSFAKYDLPRR